MLSPLLATILLTGATGDTPPAETVSRLVDRFLAADTVSRSQKEAEKIVALAPGFASIYHRIGGGRGYSADLKRGIVERSRLNRDGTRHRYLVVVPDDYDPGRRYPVSVLLHGGVTRPEWDAGEMGSWWRSGRPRSPLGAGSMPGARATRSTCAPMESGATGCFSRPRSSTWTPRSS